MLTSEEAQALFMQITATIKQDWHSALRGVGVSETDCEAIKSAFVYDGLFYETDGFIP